MQGVEEAVHFNGETVHMDIWQITFPESWEPMWIDNKYWGHCRWRGGSDIHKTILWWAKDSESVLPPHDHIQTEGLMVIKGKAIITMAETEKVYMENDTLTIDPETAHKIILNKDGMVQLTWTK